MTKDHKFYVIDRKHKKYWKISAESKASLRPALRHNIKDSDILTEQQFNKIVVKNG